MVERWAYVFIAESVLLNRRGSNNVAPVISRVFWSLLFPFANFCYSPKITTEHDKLGDIVIPNQC